MQCLRCAGRRRRHERAAIPVEHRARIVHAERHGAERRERSRRAAVRRRAPRARPDGHQGRLQCRRLRRVHGAAGRRAGVRVHGRRRAGGWPIDRLHRGPGRAPHGPRAAVRLSPARRGAVRHLYAGHADGGRGPAFAPRVAGPANGHGRPGRRALPLHRLPQDRRCGSRCGADQSEGRRSDRNRRRSAIRHLGRTPRAPARRRTQAHRRGRLRRRRRAGRCPLAEGGPLAPRARAFFHRRSGAVPCAAIPASCASSRPAMCPAKTPSASIPISRTSRCLRKASCATAASRCWPWWDRAKLSRRFRPRTSRSPGSRCRPSTASRPRWPRVHRPSTPASPTTS